jgi:hypothetical protein
VRVVVRNVDDILKLVGVHSFIFADSF